MYTYSLSFAQATAEQQLAGAISELYGKSKKRTLVNIRGGPKVVTQTIGLLAPRFVAH